MEVDEIQRQVSKFQRISSNGSTTTTENNNSNPQKIATKIGNIEVDNRGGGGGDGGTDVVDHVAIAGGDGVARLCGWPSSRIVRVSRASGGKDRHSKVLTSKGLRDRRVRLSVSTAIQFYDLQDRLGYDQPSKAVEWLLKAAASSIDELPSLDLPMAGTYSNHQNYQQMRSPKKMIENSNNLQNKLQKQNNNNASQAKSPVCSSTSETSKGSELSLSRSENRIKARERARELASKKEKEKEKEIDSSNVNNILNQVSSVDNSSFTDLLTGGINTTTAVRSQMEYFFNRPQQTPPQLFQLPQFNLTNCDNNNHHNLHHFTFPQDNLNNNNNFLMTSQSTLVGPGGYTRGTLQSNLQSSVLPQHYHHLQRFQQSTIDGSASANFPFFIVPNSSVDHYPPTSAYHFSYGSGGDHQKDKAKN